LSVGELRFDRVQAEEQSLNGGEGARQISRADRDFVVVIVRGEESVMNVGTAEVSSVLEVLLVSEQCKGSRRAITTVDVSTIDVVLAVDAGHINEGDISVHTLFVSEITTPLIIVRPAESNWCSVAMSNNNYI
jgi:hypothetical protein